MYSEERIYVVRILVEAISRTVYLIDRSPTKSLINSTTNEAWYGRNVHYLRTFGCHAFSHFSNSLLNLVINLKNASLLTTVKRIRLTRFSTQRPKRKGEGLLEVSVLMRKLLIIC